MIDHEKLTKLYYSIGEVAEMFSLSPSLIRFWETEFSKFKPKKDRRGDRRYMKKDILMLERIYILVKERGFTLEGARKELAAPSIDQKTQSNTLIINRLSALRSQLTQLKGELETK